MEVFEATDNTATQQQPVLSRSRARSKAMGLNSAGLSLLWSEEDQFLHHQQTNKANNAMILWQTADRRSKVVSEHLKCPTSMDN